MQSSAQPGGPNAAPGSSSASAPTPAPASASAPVARSSSSAVTASAGQKIFWEGMNLDQVMSNNTNPEHIVDILQANPTILRELNFHSPKLAESMRQDRTSAIKALRTHMMLNSTASVINQMTAANKEAEMEQRLRVNPMDEEANRYFGEKIRAQQVEESYVNMMQNYPESMTRVLMLYIEVQINGVPVQAFVDSGAQTSVMSGACAERCNIDRLIDSRFAGQVVGVGTGRTLGRVHVVDIKIENNFFPVSLTVMDDKNGGMGDKNMEFLLGLDMLKRHRATIDLAGGQLIFQMPNGTASTPFLHEKDLPESKGGTKGFNPDAAAKSDDAKD